MRTLFQKNLYEILGIEPTNDSKTIKSAYHVLARKFHPDVNPNDVSATKKFKEVQEAYETLSDKNKKLQYDFYKGFSNSSSSFCPPPPKNNDYTQTINHNNEQPKNDDTSKKTGFSGVFTDIMDELFKKNYSKSYKQNAKTKNTSKTTTKRASAPKNGSDITTEITISYFEAVTGTQRTINILHTEICHNCNGRRFINGSNCPLCKGKGETSVHKKLSVKIPPNVKPNAKIRIQSEGNRGINGGKNGNVYLLVKIENHTKFNFDGLDAKIEIPIAPYEAALGSEIEIPQIKDCSKKIKLIIPPNTSSGQLFKLTSQGLIDKDGRSGDMFVTVKIVLQNELSDVEKQFYEKLKRHATADVRSEFWK